MYRGILTIALTAFLSACSGHSASVPAPNLGSHSTTRKPMAFQSGSFAIFPLAPRSGPSFITFGPDGDAWFSEENGASVYHLTISTGAAYNVSKSPVTNPYPTQVIIGPDKRLWFPEYVGGGIGTLDLCQLMESGISAALTNYAYAGSQPFSMTVGSDGNLWFTDEGTNNIGRITTSGTITEYNLTNSGSQYHGIVPAYIVAGPDNNLWITDYNKGAVTVFSPSSLTVVKEFMSSPTVYPNNLTNNALPNQIIEGPDNDMWWVNSGSGTVAKISPSATSGSAPTEFSSAPLYAPSAAAKTNWAVNLVSEPSKGNVWVSDSYGDVVDVYSTSGSLVNTLNVGSDMSGAGYATAGFWCGPGVPSCSAPTIPQTSYYPYGMTVGTDGRVYVAMYNGNAVMAIAP